MSLIIVMNGGSTHRFRILKEQNKEAEPKRGTKISKARFLTGSVDQNNMRQK